MNVIKLFKDVSVDELKQRVNELKQKNFWINYHIKKNKAVVLIKHNNPVVLDQGLIIELPSLEIKATLFKVHHKLPKTVEKLSFYEIRDGTVVYLYNFDGEWLMASNKNVNIGNSRVRSHRIATLFEECGGNIYDQLDAAKSYSFGFTNTKIHHSFDGNHFWYNDVHSSIEGVKPLQPAMKLKSHDPYKDKFYGTIAIDSQNTRYVQNSKMFEDLRYLKYTKYVNKVIKENNYDYRNYIALRALLYSTDLYEKLKFFDNDLEFYINFEILFKRKSSEIVEKKIDIQHIVGEPGYVDVISADPTKLFVRKNVKILYMLIFK